MVRISKQNRNRNRSPRRPYIAGIKTGPKKDHLKSGYKKTENAISGPTAAFSFIPKIK